ncbi:hypothetical protein VTO42DRAFT_5754 [Malbranchea cinnamomea]
MSPPPKPSLAPLKTASSPKLPSELSDSPLPSAKLEAIKHDEFLKPPVTPPSAYTDFLNLLTPILTSNLPSATTERSSDRSTCSSQPSTTTSTSFSSNGPPRSPSIIIPSPSVTTRRPHSARTPRSLRPIGTSSIPESPRSASSARSPFSPSDWSFESGIRHLDSPRSATVSGRSVRMRQVITRTITYKRTPLDPAPKGKRRKTEDQEKK